MQNSQEEGFTYIIYGFYNLLFDEFLLYCLLYFLFLFLLERTKVFMIFSI